MLNNVGEKTTLTNPYSST